MFIDDHMSSSLARIQVTVHPLQPSAHSPSTSEHPRAAPKFYPASLPFPPLGFPVLPSRVRLVPTLCSPPLLPRRILRVDLMGS